LIWGLGFLLWNYILPMGFAFAIIAVVLLGVGGLAGIPIALRVIASIRLGMKERRERIAAGKQTVNREALDVLVKGATED
jgi:hypothetical protein